MLIQRIVVRVASHIGFRQSFAGNLWTSEEGQALHGELINCMVADGLGCDAIRRAVKCAELGFECDTRSAPDEVQ